MAELYKIHNTLQKLNEVVSLKPFSEYVPGHLKRIIEYQKSKLANTIIQDHNAAGGDHKEAHHSARVLVCGHRYSGRSSLIERFRGCQQDEYSRCKLPVCKFHGLVVDMQFSLTDEYDQLMEREMWMADLLILVIDVTHVDPLSPLYTYFIERIPTHLKANMVVVLTKVDLLPLSTSGGHTQNNHNKRNNKDNKDNTTQDINDTINRLLQQLRNELSIEGNSEILPFTTKDVKWGHHMLENIRKKVDMLARCADQHLTISGNVGQLVAIIEHIVADTELLVRRKREDHLFLFGDMVETYLNDDFEKELENWMKMPGNPTSIGLDNTTSSASDIIAACCILMGNKVAGTVYQLASEFWIGGLVDEELAKSLTVLLKDTLQQIFVGHAEKVTHLRACHRTVCTFVAIYTPSLMWLVWKKIVVAPPGPLWFSALLSLLPPVTALRMCGIHKKEWWQPPRRNTATLIASILKERKAEIARLCRKSVEKWLLTACRPEKTITDEIVRGIQQQQHHKKEWRDSEM